jgi:hypothetical protein
VLCEPSPAYLVMHVVWDQAADDDTGIHDHQRSRRPSRTAAVAERPLGHAAPISLATRSRVDHTDADVPRRATVRDAGTSRATTFPWCVTSISSPRSRTRRMTWLARAFNSRMPIAPMLSPCGHILKCGHKYRLGVHRGQWTNSVTGTHHPRPSTEPRRHGAWYLHGLWELAACLTALRRRTRT